MSRTRSSVNAPSPARFMMLLKIASVPLGILAIGLIGSPIGQIHAMIYPHSAGTVGHITADVIVAALRVKTVYPTWLWIAVFVSITPCILLGFELVKKRVMSGPAKGAP